MNRAARGARLLGACCVLTAGGWLAGAEPPERLSAAAPQIREIKDSGGQIVAIEAGPLPASALARWSRQPDAQAALARVLSVAVDDPAGRQTAVAGSYSTAAGALRFMPQFAFRAGQAYRAVLRCSALAPSSGAATGQVVYRFHAPAAKSSPPAEVTAIYPSAAIVPENLLRFYIHFSASMSRGNAYDHVRLLDNRNRPVDLPFLELGEELWDPRQQRLTLLIDPGRIKRGVAPREDLGTVLRAGESFTLVVNSSWLDAQNRPLRAEFTKHFRVSPAIEQAIDPAQWQIQVPAQGSHEPLAIDFPRPLDRALLERMLMVRTVLGTRIAGNVVALRDERRWELRPLQPWLAGRFEVVVDSALEDLAGNRIGRAFEVDRAGPITRQIPSDVVRLEFEIPARR